MLPLTGDSVAQLLTHLPTHPPSAVGTFLRTQFPQLNASLPLHSLWLNSQTTGQHREERREIVRRESEGREERE